MTGRVIHAIALVALALLVAPADAAAGPRERAAPARANESATDLFQQSVRAYREGRFQDAVDLLVRARTLKAEPVLLYDLGRAYEALGKPGLAADAYSQFLQEDPTAQDRMATEGRIATLRRQAEEEEARKKAAAAPPSPAANAPKPITPPPREERPPAPSGVAAAAPWVLGGVGVAGVGLGVVFGLLSRSRSDDAASEPVQTTAQSNYDGARHDATISNIGLIAGGVLVATAAVWLVWRATSTDKPSTAASLVMGRVTF